MTTTTTAMAITKERTINDGKDADETTALVSSNKNEADGKNGFYDAKKEAEAEGGGQVQQ